MIDKPPSHVARHSDLCNQIDHVMQQISAKEEEIRVAFMENRPLPSRQELQVLFQKQNDLWQKRSHFIPIGFDYPYSNPPSRSDKPIHELASFEVTEHTVDRVVHPTIILQLGDLVYHEFNIPTAIERNGKILWERQ